MKKIIKCVSLNNHKLNSDKTLFHPFTVSFNKCSGSYNTIVDPYAQVLVPNKVKNMNV